MTTHQPPGDLGVCEVHCTVCEGQDHHWDYFGDEIDGEPVYSCKHCEAVKPMDDEEDQ